MLGVILLMSVFVTVFSYQAHNAGVQHFEIPMPKAPKGFSYNNCNTTAVPMYVKSMSLQPDPVMGGEQVTAAVDLVITEKIVAPVSYDMDVYMTIGGMNQSVCELISSYFLCKDTDVCALLEKYIPPCPKGYECHCPFSPREYNFKDTRTMPKIPGGIQGIFGFKVKLAAKDGKQLMCFNMQLCYEECE